MSEIKIKIENLYKIFGSRPREYTDIVRDGVDKDELLSKYNHVLGLDNISLDIKEHSIQVVMGLSGSGKSTLIRHINRLIEPTEGTVTVDGEDITKLNKMDLLEFRRNKTGMVFQRFALFPHQNILDNVQFGLSIKNLDKSDSIERAMYWIEKVGLTGFENKFPNQLSGGMQQRVGLARALAVDPEILIFDEPFSALDPLIRREMQDELLKIQDKLQKTMVFITHDFLEAIKMGDHIAIMKDGEVSQVGTPEEIVANPIDQYVKDFCEDVPKYKVLSAGKVMRKECCDDTKKLYSSKSDCIPDNSKIETLIDKLVDTDKKFPVICNQTGDLLGEIDRSIVMKSMKSAS